MVVGIGVLVHVFASVLIVGRGVWPNGLVLHRTVHPLHLAVGLRVIATSSHRLDLECRHEFFEIVRDELAAVVVD